MVLFDEKEKPLQYGYYLVWPQTREPTPAQVRFMEWLRAEAASEPGKLGAKSEPPIFAAMDI